MLKNLLKSLGNVKLLFIGMLFMALGISLITRVQIGTTPISSLPLVTAEIAGLTFGTTTFLFNASFVLIQKCLLRERFDHINWLQIPLAFVFSFFLDICMWMLSFVDPQLYPTKLALSMLGNVFLGLGVTLEVRSKSIPLAGEGLVIACSIVFKKSFSNLKIVNDVTMVVLAAILGWFVLGSFYGIGEGTLISALTVGLFVKFFNRVFDKYHWA